MACAQYLHGTVGRIWACWSGALNRLAVLADLLALRRPLAAGGADRREAGCRTESPRASRSHIPTGCFPSPKRPSSPRRSQSAEGAARNRPSSTTSSCSTIPDSDQKFTLARINDQFNPPDWQPADHGAMPDVVAKGRKPNVMACAFCHTPTGQGRPGKFRARRPAGGLYKGAAAGLPQRQAQGRGARELRCRAANMHASRRRR